MAITGSGSLAISLFVFAISAAILPKGESPLSLRVFRTAVRLRCGIAPCAAEAGRGDDVGGRSCGAFARRDARKHRRESQHHFLRGAVDFMRCYCCFQRCFFFSRGVVLRYGVGDSEGEKKKSNLSGGFITKVAAVKTERYACAHFGAAE